MWTSGFNELLGNAGVWNLLGGALGLIWLVGVGAAMTARHMLVSDRGNQRHTGGRAKSGALTHQGAD